MKRLLITLLVLFVGVSTTFSQNSDIIKLRTTEVALMFMESNGWGEWSDWEDANILVVFDINNDRIKIFSKETQVYDVIKDEGKSYDDGDEIYSYLCVNEDGGQCRLKLWKRFRSDGSVYNQLYVNFSDVRIVYNLYVLD